jgi:hypothetical protein
MVIIDCFVLDECLYCINDIFVSESIYHCYPIIKNHGKYCIDINNTLYYYKENQRSLVIISENIEEIIYQDYHILILLGTDNNFRFHYKKNKTNIVSDLLALHADINKMNHIYTKLSPDDQKFKSTILYTDKYKNLYYIIISKINYDDYVVDEGIIYDNVNTFSFGRKLLIVNSGKKYIFFKMDEITMENPKKIVLEESLDYNFSSLLFDNNTLMLLFKDDTNVITNNNNIDELLMSTRTYLFDIPQSNLNYIVRTNESKYYDNMLISNNFGTYFIDNGKALRISKKIAKKIIKKDKYYSVHYDGLLIIYEILDDEKGINKIKEQFCH